MRPVCYLGFAWAAAAGLAPDTGYAVIGVADAPGELLTMALRRVLFLFAAFGMAAAARRALDSHNGCRLR